MMCTDDEEESMDDTNQNDITSITYYNMTHAALVAAITQQIQKYKNWCHAHHILLRIRYRSDHVHLLMTHLLLTV